MVTTGGGAQAGIAVDTSKLSRWLVEKRSFTASHRSSGTVRLSGRTILCVLVYNVVVSGKRSMARDVVDLLRTSV